MPSTAAIRATLAFLLLLSLAPRASAFIGLPKSWRVVSPDEKYLLVAISPMADKSKTQSGLYLNDGSTEPLWTVEYFGQPDELFFTADGRYVIAGGYGNYVGCIFDRGTRLAPSGKTTLDELVPAAWFKDLVTRESAEVAGCAFDPGAMTYSLTTNQGEEFVFDVATGKLIRVRSPWPLYFAVACGLVIALLGLPPLIVIWKRWKPARMSAA